MPRKFIGEADRYLWAVQIEGLDPSFVSAPFGRQIDALRTVQEWKTGAQRDWVVTKLRKGHKPATELRRWLAAVEPREFYARWDMRTNDDTREVFYR